MINKAKEHLSRSSNNRMVAGVCGGLARFLGWDPSLVRVLWVVLTLTAGFGIMLYLIFWLIVPLEDDDANGQYHE